MGLFRKVTSIGTAGLVDFRSAKDRTARKTAKGARYSKQSAKELRRQTQIMQAQNAALQQQAVHGRAVYPAPVMQQQVSGPPPGFYNDPNGQPVQRWWDGRAWTEVTR